MDSIGGEWWSYRSGTSRLSKSILLLLLYISYFKFLVNFARYWMNVGVSPTTITTIIIIWWVGTWECKVVWAVVVVKWCVLVIIYYFALSSYDTMLYYIIIILLLLLLLLYYYYYYIIIIILLFLLYYITLFYYQWNINHITIRNHHYQH